MTNSGSTTKKVLIVGSSGFLGQHLTESLVEAGAQVRGLAPQAAPQQHSQLEFIEGSFLDAPLLERALQACDVVYHLASTTLPKSSNEDPVFDVSTNLQGSIALLQLAVKCGVEKFVFVSSGGTVYGVPQYLPVDEDHPTAPTCSYGIVKLAIEKYLYMFHQLYGLDTCSLRLANPYGRYQRVDSGQGAVTAFCHKAVIGEPIAIWGDGSVVRDFIDVRDAIRAMRLAMEVDCTGKSINIGSGNGVSLNELLHHIEAACGHEVAREYQSARNFDVPEIYLDVRVAKDLLDWAPQVPLAEGIADLVRYMKSRR